MIPHIIQERSIEQDIHHTGERARCEARQDGGEERQRRPSRPWLDDKLVFLHRERWRENKDPRPVTSARPGPLWGEGAMQISSWTPLLSVGFFFFFFLFAPWTECFIYFFYFLCFVCTSLFPKWEQFTPLTLSTIIFKDIRCDFWCYKLLFPLLSHVILVLVIGLFIVKYPDQ